MIIMSFLCYQGHFFTFVHGFFNGMFIEGGCRWGFDMIWPYNNTKPISDENLVDTSSHTSAKRKLWINLRAKQSAIRKLNQEKWNDKAPKAVVAPKATAAKIDPEKQAETIIPRNYLQPSQQMVQPVMYVQPMPQHMVQPQYFRPQMPQQYAYHDPQTNLIPQYYPQAQVMQQQQQLPFELLNLLQPNRMV